MFTCVIISLFAFQVANKVLSQSVPELSSPQTTNWGDWGPWDLCPVGSLVNSITLKVESNQGDKLDDTALNGIKFWCVNSDFHSTKEITSSVGPWGSWQNVFSCPKKQFAVGFELRSEPVLGSKEDDTAANNLRLVCEDGSEIDGDGLNWGSWTGAQKCPEGFALCGLKTQVEREQGPGYNGLKNDDTSLNNLKARCCRKPSGHHQGPPPTLSATIFRIDFVDGIGEKIKKASKQKVLLQATTTIRNAGSGLLTKEITAAKTLTQKYEIEKVTALSTMHSVGLEAAFEVTNKAEIPFLGSSEVKSGFRTAYGFESTNTNQDRELNGTETQKSFEIKDSVQVPPCTVYEVDLFVNFLDNFPLDYYIYMRVTGELKNDDGQNLKADAATIIRFLDPQLKFEGYHDGNTVIVKTKGKMYADAGINTDSSAKSKPISDCKA